MQQQNITWTTVSALGHRQVPEGAETWVSEQLLHCAAWLREQRATIYAVSGMARGVDLRWAAAAVTAGLTLCAAIPFAEQADPWSRADRAEWARLRALAAREHVVGQIPAGLEPRQRSAVVNRLLHRRNGFMLDRSAGVVAVWERGRLDGGTHSALIKAATRGLPGVWIDPRSRQVRFELPGMDQLVKFALVHIDCGCVAATGTGPDMRTLHAAHLEAGYPRWQVRRARPRETATSGCTTCIAIPVKELTQQ